MAELERFVAFSMLTEESSKSMQRIKSAYMQTLGLHSGDALFLAVLEEQGGGLSSAALARACRLDRAAVSRALPRLLEAGVIACAENAKGNKYGSLLVLTPTGKCVLKKMQDFTADTVRHTSTDIPDEELKIFYRVFTLIESRLSNHARALEKRADAKEET